MGSSTDGFEYSKNVCAYGGEGNPQVDCSGEHVLTVNKAILCLYQCISKECSSTNMYSARHP